MKRLHKFLLLTSVERSLLVKAAILLATIKLGLKLLPLPDVRYLTATSARILIGGRVKSEASEEDVLRAVNLASHYIPGAHNCLNKALAVQAILRRCGKPTLIRVGVGWTARGQLIVHAWVEFQGRVLVGQLQDISRLRPLLVFGQELS